MNAKHICHALPILCQSLLYFFKESLCLRALSHALAFLRSKLSHHVLQFLRSLASRVGCYHFLIQGVAFQFGVQLLYLFLQTFHLVKELLHAFPLLGVHLTQHVTPQVRILMQRCLWLHLLRVEINLLSVSKAIHLAIGSTEILYFPLLLRIAFKLSSVIFSSHSTSVGSSSALSFSITQSIASLNSWSDKRLKLIAVCSSGISSLLHTITNSLCSAVKSILL